MPYKHITYNSVQNLPLAIRPLSVKGDKNEILFFGDRSEFAVRSEHGACILLYNIISDEYISLNDKQNYKSIGVNTNRHCIFKKDNSNNINSSEYISFDANHIALYNRQQEKMYKLKLNYINTEEFPISNALCASFCINNNNNCMFGCCT